MNLYTQPHTHPVAEAHSQDRQRVWSTVILLTILLLALTLRLWGIGWGLPSGHRRAVSYHPDENTYFWRIATMDPAEGDFIIDLRGQAFMSYVLATLLKAADVAGWFELQPSEDFYIAHPEEAAKMYLLGRAISIVSGMLSIVLIYMLIRRAFAKSPWWLAPLGALFLAIAPGHVINCHYLETDVPVTLFVLLTVYLLVNLVRLGRPRDYLFTGVSTGLAIGTKWSALPLLPLLLAAHCMRQPTWWRPATIIGKEQLKRLLILGLSLVLTFFLTNPYVALRPMESAHHIDRMGGSFFVDVGIRSFIVRLAELLTVTLPTSLGWGLYLLGCIGGILVLGDRLRTPVETLATLWVALFSIIAANTRMITIGRTLPIVPLLVTLAISAIARWRTQAVHPRTRSAVLLVGIALSVCLALGASVLADLFFCSDTAREDASRWIVGNVPPGATLGLYDQEPYWDDPDIIYQDFYHPPDAGARYRYEIYPLEPDSSPRPDTDYLIFTHRDAEKVETDLVPEQAAILCHWMEDQYEEVATFESTMHVLGLEIKGWRHRFFSPRIQILRLRQAE